MKMKLLSILLCGAMVASVLAGCDKEEKPATPDASTAPQVTAGTIPGDYVYYYSFDAKDDKDSIQATAQKIGGDPILYAADKDNTYIPGVKGDAIYTDGITGYKLTDVNGVGDNYTVSFWIYATRFANFMPTVQFGPDVHGDSTGSQHYVNITRAEWTGEGTFPCVWSYDQAADGYWPNWADANTGEQLKQWMHIALVVDSSKTTVDGKGIESQLYINGQEFISKDSDGNVVAPIITKGCMAQSDNFDFLIGVNYWDAIFKGAFDELYVYNYALDASQVAALYADGDANAAYVEPERVISVATAENAIASLGALDFSKADDVYAEDIALGDGQTMQLKLKHWSDGKDAKNNYYFVFKDAEGNEVARVNADMTGTAGGADIDASAFKWSWNNWNTWEQSVMVETDVTANITRNGNEITVEIDNVDYNKVSNTATAVFTVDGVEKFTVGTVNAYTDILAIKDTTVRAGGIIVGSTARDTAFWSAFSDIFAIPEGESVTKTFYNYTDGTANWNNYLCILQNTPVGHSADAAEGYAEYAVLRADNWGWGAGFDGIAEKETDNDFSDFATDMDGAHVSVTITNNGATADVTAVYTTVAGKTYNQKYTGIAVNGPLYACFTCEKSYLSFDSVIVGNTDRSTGFWSTFSDIYAVPEGQSKTVYFKNYTDGTANWNNYLVALQNTPDAHSADSDANYKEYAVVRADNWGWGAGFDGIAEKDTNNDFSNFAEDMDGAYVALTVKNNGTTADVNAVVTTVAGVQYYQNYTGIAIDGPLYFTLFCEKSYLQIECENVGNTDKTTAFWSKFSNIFAVKEGETVSKSFTNYTNGEANWNNYLMVLQTTPTGHSADAAEGYAEYAVLRADNWGWGAGFDGIAEKETDNDFSDFATDMDGANVVAFVTNNGSTADVEFVVTTKAGKVFHQNYKNIAITGDLYFCFLCEGSYLALN